MKTTIIEKTNPAFPLLKWCSLALSKDKARPTLNLLNVEGSHDKPEINVVATDGRRLHAVAFPPTPKNPAPLVPGLYGVRATAREIVFIEQDPEKFPPFPDWRRVLPNFPEDKPDLGGEGPAEKDLVAGTYEASSGKDGLVSCLTAALNRRRDCSLVFNDSYLRDLLGDKTLLTKRRVFTWDYKTVYQGPLLVKGEASLAGASLTGVLMPMRD